MQELSKIEKEILSITARFNLNSDDLDAESKEFLDRVIAILVEKEANNIKINGQTCALEEEDLNKELGLDRALIVKEYLISKGIRINTASKGGNDPIATNDTPAGRQENRRVEFEVNY